MNNSYKIILNTAVSYISLLARMIIGLFAIRLVLSALGEVDYGVYVIVGGVVAMLDVLNTNMSNTSMRYLAYSLGKKDENEIYITFNSTVVIHYLIGLFTIIILEIGGLIMFEYVINIPEDKMADGKMIYQFMVISTFISVITVPYDAVINAHEKIWVLSLFDILSSAFVLTVALILLSFSGNRLLFYGFFLMVIQISVCLLKMSLAKRNFIECRKFNKSRVEKKRIREILSFTGWNLFSSLAGLGVTQFRSLILNYFFGVRLNAAEGVANQVAAPLNNVVVGMTRAINPQIMKSEGGDDHERMKYIVELGAKYSSFLFALFGIPVLLKIPFLLNIWLDTVPKYATVFCQLLIISMLIEKFTYQITHAISAVGRIKNFQIALSIGSLIYLPFAVLFFKIGFPPVTIYVLSIITILINAAIRIYYGKKVAGISPTDFYLNAINPVMLPLLVSTFLSFVVSYLIKDSLLNFIFTTSLFMTLFIILFWKLGCKTEERYKWKSIASQIASKIKIIKERS